MTKKLSHLFAFFTTIVLVLFLMMACNFNENETLNISFYGCSVVNDESEDELASPGETFCLQVSFSYQGRL